MKIFLTVFLMCFISIGSLFAQGYHISGSQIYDGNNTAVVFKGTNVNGANWVWPRETTQDASLIINDWKFNIIRVNCVLYGSNYTTNNNYDNIVNTFTGMGAIVIFEVHDFTGKEPTDAQLIDLKNFWIDKANRYKGNSSVWFNIENEPVDGWNGSVTLTTRWRDVHDEVIGSIRGTGANNICICDDNGWGSGGWQASTSGILTYGAYLTAKYSNVAFGLHFYDDRHTQTEYTNWINSIVANGLCPIVGEFGVDGGGPSPLTPGLVLNALNSSNQLKMVTRLSWAWAGGDNNDYCSSGGDGAGGGYNINKTDGTKPTNLSAFGSLIWDDSHASTPPANVPVSGVSLNLTSVIVSVGATRQLAATVIPSNATNKTVSWSSSNTSAATVSSSGLVTGISAGSSTITVTTQDQGKTATAAITVNASPSQSPYNGLITLPAKVEAENYDNGGENVAYHDADAANNGGVYRTSEGVDIQSCSEGGYNVGWIASGEWLEYTVNPGAGIYDIEIRYAGTSAGTLEVVFDNGNKSTGDISLPSTGGFQNWASVTKTGISLNAGQQIMRINLKSGGFNLNYINVKSQSAVPVTGVSVNPSTASIGIGATQTLAATVAPGNATNKSLTWNSSNTSVATVSSSGVVTGVSAGTAIITVTTQDGNKTATCAVTVTSAGAGVLSGSLSTASGNYNLTIAGTADWMNWGRGSTYANVDRKSGGTLINSVTNAGTGEAHGGWTGPKFSTSWTNGSPTVSATNDQGYIWSNGALNSGLSFTVKADGTPQTLYVLCGLNGVAAKLTAHLSDNSAADYVNTQSGSGSGATLYKVNYQAQSANQKLTITLLKTSNITGTNGSVDLKAAWVVNGFNNNAARRAAITPDKTLKIQSAFDVQIYPNPVTSQSYLMINSADACKVKVRVVDVNGKLIYTKKLDVFGVMNLPLDFLQSQRGTFFIQVQKNNQIITKRLIKAE